MQDDAMRCNAQTTFKIPCCNRGCFCSALHFVALFNPKEKKGNEPSVLISNKTKQNKNFKKKDYTKCNNTPAPVSKKRIYHKSNNRKGFRSIFVRIVSWYKVKKMNDETREASKKSIFSVSFRFVTCQIQSFNRFNRFNPSIIPSLLI